MIFQAIKQFIDSKGITQASIAKKAGMTKVSLSESLRGNRRLTADEYVRICDALGVSADFFNQGCSPEYLIEQTDERDGEAVTK